MSGREEGKEGRREGGRKGGKEGGRKGERTERTDKRTEEGRNSLRELTSVLFRSPPLLPNILTQFKSPSAAATMIGGEPDSLASSFMTFRRSLLFLGLSLSMEWTVVRNVMTFVGFRMAQAACRG